MMACLPENVLMYGSKTMTKRENKKPRIRIEHMLDVDRIDRVLNAVVRVF